MLHGHVLMENRHGLVVEAELTRAAGFAERWGGDRADRRTHRAAADHRGRRSRLWPRATLRSAFNLLRSAWVF